MNRKIVLSAMLLACCWLAAGCTEHVIGAVTKHQARSHGGTSPDGRDYCRMNAWYGDGACDSWCPKRDPDCALDAGPAGERCGPNVCAPGEVCCNESCGICTEPGGACTQQACAYDASCGDRDAGPPGEQCGPNVCAPGEVCCNESCGICTQPGEGCIEIWCGPQDAGPRDAGSCFPLCAEPPPGCHYEGPVTCDPPSCGKLVCDEDAGSPEEDCRTTGCPRGSYCDVCWVGYACIPNGAVC